MYQYFAPFNLLSTNHNRTPITPYLNSSLLDNLKSCLTNSLRPKSEKECRIKYRDIFEVDKPVVFQQPDQTLLRFDISHIDVRK